MQAALLGQPRTSIHEIQRLLVAVPHSSSVPGQVRKCVSCWRFAPACCAAQSVCRARPAAALSVVTLCSCGAIGGQAQKPIRFSTHRGFRQISMARSCNAERITLFKHKQASALIARWSRLACAPKVPANTSLNRTRCGVPPFGLQNRSPNAVTPQRSG